MSIHAEGLRKKYRYYPVLRHVSLRVSPGECYVLFGANGSGKTTLLKVLATALRPNGGTFAIAGHDGEREKEAARKNLLLMTHGSHLYEDLNATENLRFSAGLRAFAWNRARAEEALERVGLARFTDYPVRQYSNGMKKRLTLAKALLFQPAVLLLDEPYAALDEQGIRLVNDFLRTYTSEGGTVLMTTHNRHFGLDAAHRAGFLAEGRLRDLQPAEYDTLHELY